MSGNETVLDDILDAAIDDVSEVAEPTETYTLNDMRESVNTELDGGVSLDFELDKIPASEVYDTEEFEAETEEKTPTNLKNAEMLYKNGFVKTDSDNEVIFYNVIRLMFIRGKRFGIYKNGYLPIKSKYSDSIFKGIIKEDTAKTEEESLRLDLQTYDSILKEHASNLKNSNLVDSDAHDSINNRITKIVVELGNVSLPSCLPSKFDLDVVSAIRQTIIDSNLQNAESIKPNVIIDMLTYNNTELRNIIAANYNAVYNYVTTALTIYNNVIYDNTTDAERVQQLRKKQAMFLLKEEFDLLDHYNDLLDQNNLFFIRQILCQNNSYFVKCPKCGELIHVTSPIFRVCTYPMNGGKLFCLPDSVKCSCGAESILTEPDVSLAELYLTLVNSKVMHDYNETASCICPTNAFSRSKLGAAKFKRIEEYFNNHGIPGKGNNYKKTFVCVDVDVDATASVEDTDQVRKVPFKIVSDLEYQRAVKLFYDTLDSIPKVKMSITQDNDTESLEYTELAGPVKQDIVDDLGGNTNLSYREMAVYVADLLSLDYKALKNKALFSLIFMIKENKLLNSYLDNTNLYDLEKLIDLIDVASHYSAASFPPELILTIENLCNTYRGLEIIDSDDLSVNRQKLEPYLKVLPEIKEEIKQKVAELKNKRDRIIQIFKEHKNALMFTKIINVTTISLEEVDKIMVDKEFFNLLDETADRMIIANYAFDLYNRWRLLAKVHNTTMAGLNNANDATVLHEAVSKFIDKKNLIELMTVTPNTDLTLTSYQRAFNHFCYVIDISPISLEHNAKVNNYMKKCDIYSMIKETLNIVPADVNTFGQKYRERLEEAVEHVTKANLIDFSKYRTNYEYYLSLVGFDLDTEVYDKSLLLETSFGRFLLKKEENETVDSYLKRYNKLQGLNELTDSNCIDLLDLIKDYAEDFIVIGLGGLLNEVEYTNFVQSMFMISLTEFLHDETSKYTAVNFLGSTLDLNRILNRKVYKPDLCNHSGEFITRVLDGLYYSPIHVELAKHYQEYKKYLIHAQDDLTEIGQTFNAEDIKNSIEGYIDMLEETNKSIKESSANKADADSQDGKGLITDYDCDEMRVEFRTRIKNVEGV